MISNLDKYKMDLDRLIAEGGSLFNAMLQEFSPDEFQVSLKNNFKTKKKIDAFIKELPSFTEEYQKWYSEALVLLGQLLPGRVSDFMKLYEKAKNRKTLTFGNYVIEDALIGIHVNTLNVGPHSAISRFQQQLSIVKSVKQRFESSLFDIKQLVQSDVFDSEIDAAGELNKKGFTRAAGAMSGVVLEGHLLQVCHNHNVVVKKQHPGINDLAQYLKDKSVIDTPGWRKIQHLADLRNHCDHKKKTEPNTEDIDELISGVDKIIKTLF
jgi:hypothetical protein